MDAGPKYLIRFDKGEWLRISPSEYELYISAFVKAPSFWEGVSLAIQFTLITV